MTTSIHVTQVTCFEHRVWHPNLSLYTDAGQSSNCTTHECETNTVTKTNHYCHVFGLTEDFTIRLQVHYICNNVSRK